MFRGDTITAISTPPGRGGIGIVRLSGPASLEIARSIFHPESGGEIQIPSRAYFGRVIDPATGESLDEALCTCFKAPHSYTGEDLIELSCHGSPVILSRVLELATNGGARIAEPGEFTFRAFLNKRIDLAQAQAVRDVINAQTAFQARVAGRQLGGALSGRLTPIKDALVQVIVHLESSVEFVEDDISPAASAQLSSRLEEMATDLERLAAGFAFGRYVREGFDLAIVGRPNVGKSSIFNRLIGADRAIVTPIPGTTRDTLHENAAISGLPVRLIDTAGIRQTTDVVENMGISRTRSAIADADISILVLDASEPLTDDDIRLLHEVPSGRRLIVYNKTDLLGTRIPGYLEYDPRIETLPISARTGAGFDALTGRIIEHLSGDSSAGREDAIVTDARQHAALRHAAERLVSAVELMEAGELEEVILLRLHEALTSLGEITGETLTDDILAQIFSTFCIGK